MFSDDSFGNQIIDEHQIRLAKSPNSFNLCNVLPMCLEQTFIPIYQNGTKRFFV